MLKSNRKIQYIAKVATQLLFPQRIGYPDYIMQLGRSFLKGN